VIGESGAVLSRKLRAALSADLVPIYCVGELLEEREEGRASAVVSAQVEDCLKGVETADLERIVLAYEPVWAIGTGKTATPRDASSMHGGIRGILGNLFSPAEAERMVILYGGSVKPDNAADLLSAPDIDGALVGGASLTADAFLGIVDAAPGGGAKTI
jgi:triosephosphate isomerase